MAEIHAFHRTSCETAQEALASAMADKPSTVVIMAFYDNDQTFRMISSPVDSVTFAVGALHRMAAYLDRD